MDETRIAVGDTLRLLDGVESVRERTRGNDFERYTEWVVRGSAGAGEVRGAVESALQDRGYYETSLRVYKERDGAIVVSPEGSERPI